MTRTTREEREQAKLWQRLSKPEPDTEPKRRWKFLTDIGFYDALPEGTEVPIILLIIAVLMVASFMFV